MMNKDFIIGTFLIIIPLVLLILCYRSYVYNYCQNDMKCLKEKLIFNLNNINNKLKKSDAYQSINEKSKISNNDWYPEAQSEGDQIEGFFGGLGDWFSGSTPSNLPISPGSFGTENLNILEKKINDKMITSNKFPPTELNGNSDDFKDSSNLDILKNTSPVIGSIPPSIKLPETNKRLEKVPNLSESTSLNQVSSKVLNNISGNNIPVESNSKKNSIKELLGTCQFFNDKCPDKYHQLGNFSIEGAGSSSILTCGNVQNTKPARAIAQIKNNSVYEIHITDPGHGFNPESSPKVSIEGGKGHGATAEAVIDDNGFLKLIKIINPGYNYSETPNVLIDAPFMNSSCHLCCKD